MPKPSLILEPEGSSGGQRDVSGFPLNGPAQQHTRLRSPVCDLGSKGIQNNSNTAGDTNLVRVSRGSEKIAQRSGFTKHFCNSGITFRLKKCFVNAKVFVDSMFNGSARQYTVRSPGGISGCSVWRAAPAPAWRHRASPGCWRPSRRTFRILLASPGQTRARE